MIAKHAPSLLYISPTRIGDAVLASSVLSALAARVHATEIDVIAGSLVAPLYEALPGLRHLHVIDKRSFSRHWLMMWQRTIAHRYSAVVDMRASALAYCLRARARFIFRGSAEGISKHQQFASWLGEPSLPYPELWTNDKDEHAAENLCAGQRFFALAPMANWPPKEWPLERFIALARALRSEHSGHRMMLICAPHERARMQPAIDALADSQPLILSDAAYHLRIIYACLKRADLFIGNDSGLMHMAAAAGIPTLGLFGPTPMDVYGAVGKHARSLSAADGALDTISVDEVLAEGLALMKARHLAV